ncbi:MAG: glucosaminidase domain-containing protein [Pseudomonadota bacterium]
MTRMPGQQDTISPPQSVSPLFVAMLCVLLLSGSVWWVYQQRFIQLPDFAASATVKEKKQAFFAYLKPRIAGANQAIQRDRNTLERLQQSLNSTAGNAGASPAPVPVTASASANASPIAKQSQLAWYDRVQLNNIAARYHIEFDGATSDQSLLDEALRRVNTVPASLVLIQAAKESGWGSSKFARQGNNLFGHQCFEAGCGMLPAARESGRRHEVKRFSRPGDAISAYLQNLNTHPRYAQFRQLRAQMASAGEPLSGIKLADGLLAYSERGEAYVREVQSMIRSNALE